MVGKEAVKFKLSICKFIPYYINPTTLFLLGCMANITFIEAVSNKTPILKENRENLDNQTQCICRVNRIQSNMVEYITLQLT